jgi:hypothetical protein
MATRGQRIYLREKPEEKHLTLKLPIEQDARPFLLLPERCFGVRLRAKS